MATDWYCALPEGALAVTPIRAPAVLSPPDVSPAERVRIELDRDAG
ncbi:MAG: hypothetical protein OEQ18_13400 [Gammaproteobacteria bacterium]|nr:hypothetical protein [Gammaproteobacteria bacterium]